MMIPEEESHEEASPTNASRHQKLRRDSLPLEPIIPIPVPKEAEKKSEPWYFKVAISSYLAKRAAAVVAGAP